MSLSEEFLANHQRYLPVFGDDLGFVPHTEASRKTGLGEWSRPLTEATRQQARDLLAEPPTADVGRLRLFAAAYEEGGDEAYAEAARATYEQWVAAYPAATVKALNPSKSIDLAHHLYTWLGQLHLFLPSPAFDEDIVRAAIDCARLQLGHLHAEVYPARNLRITAASSLLCNSLRLAFLPEAQAWIAAGARFMSDAMQRQILPDGSHLEATPHYCFCTMGDILNVYRKARLLPELGIDVPPEHVAGLFDYLVAATTPNGWVTGIGDGPYSDPVAVRGQGIADVVAERDGYRRWLGLPEEPLPAAQHFPDAGQVFLRDGWGTDAAYLTFNNAPCRSYHWHPAANSIQLQAHGRMLVVDPGRFSYSDKDWGPCAWPTSSHSTVNLNGWNQSPCQPQLRHAAAPGYDLVTGQYDGGYWPGRGDSGMEPGIHASHHRTLLWVRQRCLLVIDQVHCPHPAGAEPDMELVWQLTPAQVTLDQTQRLAYTNHADSNLLLLFPLAPADAALRIVEGEEDPRRGWVPATFEESYAPAPQVVLRVERNDPWNSSLVTVLAPFAGAQPPTIEVDNVVDPDGTGDFYHPGHGQVRLRWDDGSTDEFWWTRRLESALGEQAEFVTDGGLVHLARDAEGNVVRGLAADATFVEPWSKAAGGRPGMLCWEGAT